MFSFYNTFLKLSVELVFNIFYFFQIIFFNFLTFILMAIHIFYDSLQGSKEKLYFSLLDMNCFGVTGRSSGILHR